MANLINSINRKRCKIKGITREINDCGKTEAGLWLKRTLILDRDEMYNELGRLVTNSEIKICLQSQFTS